MFLLNHACYVHDLKPIWRKKVENGAGFISICLILSNIIWCQVFYLVVTRKILAIQNFSLIIFKNHTKEKFIKCLKTHKNEKDGTEVSRKKLYYTLEYAILNRGLPKCSEICAFINF